MQDQAGQGSQVDLPDVYYCHAEPDSEVVEFLRSEPIRLTLVDTGVDDEAYWRFLDERWRAGTSFVVVEQDVLPYPGAIQEIWDCPVAMCGKPYQIWSGYVACFGCTKFSADLIAAYPEAIEAGGQRFQPCGNPPLGGLGYRHWETLDSRIVLAMHEMGWGIEPQPQGQMWPHQHWPIVKHKHSYPGLEQTVLAPPPAIPNMGVTWWL